MQAKHLCVLTTEFKTTIRRQQNAFKPPSSFSKVMFLLYLINCLMHLPLFVWFCIGLCSGVH